MTLSLAERLNGVLLGTAVGDALGLPCEGLSKKRQARMYPDLSRYHLLWGYGLCSDDTEHSCMVAQALIQAEGDPQRFARSLGWKLRFWLLALPAGIGMATLKAILKLWLGFSPERSGVVSAGNGPAMRSPITLESVIAYLNSRALGLAGDKKSTPGRKAGWNRNPAGDFRTRAL